MSGPLAYSVQGAAEALGVSPSHVNRLIAKGHIKAKSTDRDADGNPTGKRLIPAESLRAYLEGLVDA